ncbi:hypothetical protein DSUL_50187 [Desulfovibrionales bacterium]
MIQILPYSVLEKCIIKNIYCIDAITNLYRVLLDIHSIYNI